MSAIDSELKSGRPGIAELSWPVILWCVVAFAGLAVTPWWTIPGLGIVLVAGIALLDRCGIVRLRRSPQSVRDLTRQRIEAYYMKGQDLYFRLADDPNIAPETVRQFVADVWVNPTTDYLRGALGEAQATYFLSIRRSALDDAAIQQDGYQKALARKRIMVRLERLRKISSEI